MVVIDGDDFHAMGDPPRTAISYGIQWEETDLFEFDEATAREIVAERDAAASQRNQRRPILMFREGGGQ